jgi:PPOX class probable F420-dependent enzyme
VESTEALERVGQARIARLATIGGGGAPHVVPITFAINDGEVVSAVDHKPKTTVHLVRLANIARDPRVAVLVDHYTEEWDQLWWVRVDGRARLIEDGSQHRTALEALIEKYPQYREHPPQGQVIRIAIERITGWNARG